MGKYFLLFLIPLQFLFAQKNENIIRIPKGSSLANEYSINQNALKSAKQIKLADGGEIYLAHDDEYLYFCFRGVYEPWSHLYLNCRSNVYVLHITPSMGRVTYNMSHYGTWRPDRQFNWKMKSREHDYEENKVVDKKSFLEKDGWITTINSTGEKKEVVFKIALKNYDLNNLYIAWVYGIKGTSYSYWPTTLNDDTLKPEIFTGYNPSNLKFDFYRWALLKLDE